MSFSSPEDVEKEDEDVSAETDSVPNCLGANARRCGHMLAANRN
jgi:hypothetical protein